VPFDPVSSGVMFNESEISVTDAPGLGIRAIEGLVLVEPAPGLRRAKCPMPLVKIRSERDQMSAIERRIADFILDNAHLLRDYSSQQLANALGISQSSVVKFSQKLGFKGYPDLKYCRSARRWRADNGNGGTPSAAERRHPRRDHRRRPVAAQDRGRGSHPPDQSAGRGRSRCRGDRQPPARCSSSAWATTTSTRAPSPCGCRCSASSRCTTSIPRT
jgi:hypothetical protein